MKYTSIDFTNVGPIEDGTVHRDKLSVFIGPNNSGKTIAAKIIHGVCQTDESPGVPPIPAGVTVPSDKESMSALAPAVHAMTLIRHAGMRPDAVPTHGRKRSAISVHGVDGSTRRFDFASARGNHLAYGISLAKDGSPNNIKRSMYTPATRAGSAQYILGIMHTLLKMAQVKSDLLNQMLSTIAAGAEESGRAKISVDQNDLLADPIFDDLSRDAGTMLETLTSGLDEKAQETFSRFFPGVIKVVERSRAPLVTYSDPSGHQSGIESAGSGIASLLPVVAGIHRIEEGGACVIEEPESHLEPQKQLILIDEILRIANESRIAMVITTQSDFLVQKALSLVSSGSLDRSELGLYYFRRPVDSLTRIQKVHVEKTGEAEQEMFTKAMDSLIEGF